MDDDEWIVEVRAAAGSCPACGGDTAQPILYGLPEPEEVDRLRGMVGFAGCLVPEDPARFSCSRCGATWGRGYETDQDEPQQAEP